MKSVDTNQPKLDRIGRRHVLGLATSVGGVAFAGCLGDGESADDTEDDTANESAADLTNNEANGDDGTAPEGSHGDDGDENNQPEIRPSEIDLKPDSAWASDHWDIEVPDEPGQAVLVVDDIRVEMVGDFSGGPNIGLYETVTEEDEFTGDGTYFLADGLFEPTEESLTGHGWETGHQIRFFRRVVGWAGNQLSYLTNDSLNLYWPNMLQSAEYLYRQDPDGAIVDSGGLEGRTYAEESFLRLDSSGVLTAVGTIDDPGNSDVPEGAIFEFGARAQDQWTERWEGN
jgi:hypothetical protein